MSARLLAIYARLLATYGPQGWWPGGHDPFEVVVGAILTQAVAWSNVERALANLHAAGALSPEGILALSETELGRLIQPSGYFLVKARRLQGFARMLVQEFRGSLEHLFALPLPQLRVKLLATYGVGEETADDIILYAAHQPSFVVDAYTVRLFTRLGITPPELAPSDNGRTARPTSHSYRDWQQLFTGHLPADVQLFNEYHALIVRHGVERCRKRDPRCDVCPLLDLCPVGREGPSPRRQTRLAAVPASTCHGRSRSPQPRVSGPRYASGARRWSICRGSTRFPRRGGFCFSQRRPP